MNRKHNPWAALVGLLLGLLLVIFCAGCASVDATYPGEPAEESGRFTIEHHTMTSSIYGVRIITDNETGVQYLVYTNGQGCGMTVLQEKEG